jgi:hypothetical protein
MHLFTRKSHAGSYLRSFNRQAVRVEAEAVGATSLPAIMDGGVARQFEASGVPTSGTRPGNTCASPTGIKACDLIGSRCVAMSVEHPVPLASSIPPAGGKPTDAPSVTPPALISGATDHKKVSNLDGEKPTGAQGCYQSAGSVASA